MLFISWNSASRIGVVSLRDTLTQVTRPFWKSTMGRQTPETIGVRAQSTLGVQDIFARKYMYEKLTKCPNFKLDMIFARKLAKFLNFT